MSRVVSWDEYYRTVEGRSPRPLFVDGLALAAGPGVAVDVGCGDGTETLTLLAGGWTVFAADGAPEAIERLRSSVPAETAGRLTAVVAPFHELEPPAADFVYAGLSLPFCSPDHFCESWRRITGALRPGGILAVHLFGPRDSWANNRDMTFHTREEVDALLDGFDVRSLVEQDEDGQAVSGSKHWHVFHVIAAKR